jgi:hypothetical protein
MVNRILKLDSDLSCHPPLGPTKIDFNQNVGREFRWKPSLDDMGSFQRPSVDLQTSFFSPKSGMVRQSKKSKSPEVESDGRPNPGSLR